MFIIFNSIYDKRCPHVSSHDILKWTSCIYNGEGCFKITLSCCSAPKWEEELDEEEDQEAFAWPSIFH